MAVTNVNFSGKAKTAPMTPTINTTPLPQSSTFNGGSSDSSGSSWLTSALNAVGNVASSTPFGMLASLGTSLYNQYKEDKRAAQQQAWNEQMMDKQNQWSLDMWNKTNEYNSPAAQVQRMQDAGLNPLFYGLDGNSAQGLESAQALGYERASGVPIENPIQASIDYKLRQAQLENIQANTAKQSNETLTETQRRQNMIAELDNIRQDLRNKIASENLTDAQRRECEKRLEWADRQNAAVVALHESQSKLTNAQEKRIIELLEGEKVIQSKDIEEFEHRWNLWSAQAAKDSALAGLTMTDIENYALNHMTPGLFGTGFSAQNLARSKRSSDDGHLKPQSSKKAANEVVRGR